MFCEIFGVNICTSCAHIYMYYIVVKDDIIITSFFFFLMTLWCLLCAIKKEGKGNK